MVFVSVKLLPLLTILWTTSTLAQDATSRFRQALIDLANDDLGVQAYQDYINTATELTYSTTNVPGDQLVSQIANTLAARMTSQSDMLRKTRTTIEEQLGKITSGTGTLLNCCNVSSSGKAYDSRFRNETDTNSMCSLGLSTSPVPTLSTSVLSGMRAYLQQYPSLRWQYFGTEDGNMYRFPATVGQTCDKTVFDPRMSVWYKSTISPNAKDVVILIQRSNSMKPVLTQAIQAAQLIVNNLNSKDQVAVVAFSDQITSSTSDSCYTTQLSILNDRTKKDFDSFLNNLAVTGSANFTLAFQTAFSLFMSSLNGSTAGLDQRDRAIVLITNGNGLDSQQQSTLNAIKEGNGQLRNQVVIFAYTFDGSTLALLTSITQQVNNDGWFGETVSMNPQQILANQTDKPSLLRTVMADFFTTFARTDVNAPIVYTVPYSDSTVGLIMSLCVPVKQLGRLFGVTCVDVTMDTLFSEVQYFQQTSSSYAFLMDGYGRLLIHPLLPQLSTLSVDTPLAELTDIEYDTDGNILKVRYGMLSQIPGNLTFVSRTVKPRGDKTLKGVSSEMNRHTYYWQPVAAGTHFSVCVVIDDNYQNGSVIWQSSNTNYSYPPVYLMDYEPLNDTTPERCNFRGRIVLRNTSMVKLAPQTFLQPSSFLDINYNDTVHKNWHDYLEGRVTTSAYIKPNIRDSVASTYKMEEIWQQRDTSAFAAWRFIGRNDGTYRKFPAGRFAKDYDPTLRPWYQQAVAESNNYAFYGPDIDASATGCYVNLATTITRNVTTTDDASKLFGVIGMTFNRSYFYDLLWKNLPNCTQPNVQCLIIDKSGYLLMHYTFLQSSFDCTTLHHITCLEKSIAQDMITNGFLVNDMCINYADDTQLTFWKVKLNSNPQWTDNYVIYGIDGTNLFVIIKYKDPAGDTPCTCYSDLNSCSSSFTSSSSSATCQSPCYSPSTYSQVCLGRPSYNSSTPPCYPPPPSLSGKSLAAEEAPYVSALCPCQGPVNCSMNIPGSTVTTTSSNPSALSSPDTRSTTEATNVAPSSSSSSNLLPLLALLALLIVPVIFFFLWCKAKRLSKNKTDSGFTESAAYRYFNFFMRQQKVAETDPQYTEIDPVNVLPGSLQRPSVVDSDEYFAFKCGPKEGRDEVLSNDVQLMTESPAYGKSMGMVNNNGTKRPISSTKSNSGHVTPESRNIESVYLQLKNSEPPTPKDCQLQNFNSIGINSHDVMTEKPACGKPPNTLDNSSTTFDGDGDQTRELTDIITGSNSEFPSIHNPDDGIYLHVIDSETPRPVTSEASYVRNSQSSNTYIQQQRQQLQGSLFDGQPQLTTLEKQTWIEDDDNVDDVDDDDDKSMVTYKNGHIHVKLNENEEQEVNSVRQTGIRGSNVNNQVMLI